MVKYDHVQSASTELDNIDNIGYHWSISRKPTLDWGKALNRRVKTLKIIRVNSKQQYRTCCRALQLGNDAELTVKQLIILSTVRCRFQNVLDLEILCDILMGIRSVTTNSILTWN